MTAPDAAACGPGAGGPGTGGAPNPAFWLQATQTAATAHSAAATERARVGIGAGYSAWRPARPPSRSLSGISGIRRWLEDQFVHEAPAPVFARLEGADDWMLAAREMFR